VSGNKWFPKLDRARIIRAVTNDPAAKRDYVRLSFSEAAATYDVSPYFDMPGRRIVQLAGVQPGHRVLDVATGRGAVLWPALDAVGPDGYVEGIDIAKPMADLTMADIQAKNVTNAIVHVMDAESLDFPDESFDCVLCGFGLWFIPDLDRALGEMKRVLQPGGSFGATTWAGGSELNRRFGDLARTFGIGGDNLASHSLGTPEALTAVLRQAGFGNITTSRADVSYTFDSAEEWWTRVAARPQLVHSLSPEDHERLKQAALVLASEYMSDGRLENTRGVNFVTARKPA
jgi:SAM-dependent methyltransferase